MPHKLIVIAALILLGLIPADAQRKSIISLEGFGPPVNIPIYLSGTFGELRGSHFHSGIDIKTQGREGLPIFAVADGHISRIKVSATGYGNALYIDHPSGHTSVYAHLSKFNPEIDSFIKKIHYQKESFELDEYLEPGTITLKKGEQIGLSGNTGGSGGPHLHFEIRERRSQIPLNPQYYNFDIIDSLAPEIKYLYLYTADEFQSGKKKYRVNRKKEGQYYLSKDTLVVNSGSIGFGVNTYDRMEGCNNRNGVNQITLKSNGVTVFNVKMDKFSFDQTRYIQAHTDYGAKVEDRLKVHRCFLVDGNKLSTLYDSTQNKGFIILKPGEIKQITLDVRDVFGNASTLKFQVLYDPKSEVFAFNNSQFDTVFYPSTPNIYQTDHTRISFPSNTFYEKTFFTYDEQGGAAEEDIYSNIAIINKETEPVHKRYQLAIKPKGLPDSLSSKALIVRKTRNGWLDPYNSNFVGEYLMARPREFGPFYVTIDTKKPRIAPVNIYNKKDMSKSKTIRLKISDNLSGINTYRATIDGKWALFEYDAKNNLLTYRFDDTRVSKGEHKLKVVVTDNVGNKATYSISFTR